MNDENHLPTIGVGPAIVAPQLVLTATGIVLSRLKVFAFACFDMLRIPFLTLGIVIILFGIYLWISANFKTKVDKYIETNKLATNGVYGIVRNPIYSAFLMVCVGAILIADNLLLFGIPVLCWIYMTIFLKKTEEKWLIDLYGQEYVDYCKNVNRCIPWFPKK